MKQGQRYKRYQANLIESGFHTALVQTLTQILKTDEWQARVEAHKYYSDDLEERDTVLILLQQFGVSVETLYAKAMSLNAAAIAVLDRMISNRKSSRSNLLEDHDKLLQRLEKPASIPGSIVQI